MEQTKIMPNNLLRDFEQYQKEFEDAALLALRSGWYILGEQLCSFEVWRQDWMLFGSRSGSWASVKGMK